MVFLCSIRSFFVTFLLTYTVYLFSYKCDKLNETPLEHGIQTVFHPLSHAHNQVCDSLNKGVNFVSPYLDSFHAKVASHQLYKDYKVQDKVDCAGGYYSKYAQPYVLQVFQLVETYEEILVAHLLVVWAKIQAFYASEVAPKLKLA